MFTTWLGDMITDRGIGNGISMIIMAGIIARVPSGIHQVFTEEFQGASSLWEPILYIVILLLVILAIVTFVTYVQQANYKIPIQYTRRVAGASENSYLPLKVNVAGVIPVIFASSFIATPQTILMLFTQNHSEDTWYKVMSIYSICKLFQV